MYRMTMSVEQVLSSALLLGEAIGLAFALERGLLCGSDGAVVLLFPETLFPLLDPVLE